MNSDFEISGSTAELSADDLLREICGDEPAAEGIVGDEAEERFAKAKATEKGDEEGEPESLQEEMGDDFLVQPPSVEAGGELLDQSDSPELTFGFVDCIDDYLAAHNGQYFVWDLETFPDESRFPRPLQVNRERQEVDLVKLASGNADIIIRTLKSNVLLEDQLEELLELENAGKMRPTVLKEIEKAFSNMDGEFDKWKKEGSLDPWKGRIVAFSWSFLGEEDVHTMLANNEDEERELLATFWALQSVGIRVGYNTSAFDDKWIVVRSMILGIEPLVQMDMSKYSNRQSVDIMLKLFPNPSEAMGCKTVAQILGIQIPAEGVSGGDVFGIVEAQDWLNLQKYSASDVVVEKELFKRVKRYVRV